MIHIAFVIDTIATPGAGTEKQLLLLVRHLDRSRFEPHLLCLQSSPWLERNSLPCPVEIIGVRSLRSPATTGALLRFRRYVRRHRIDIVQTFFIDSNLFGTVSGWLSGVPVIISSRRNFGKDYWHTPAWLFLLRLLRRLTTCYIANSRLTADYSIEVERIAADRMHVIYNGLDFAPFANLTPELRAAARSAWGVADRHVLIGIIANLRPIKNHRLFVEAAARVHSRRPDTRFLIAGDGDQREPIECRLHELGLQDTAILTGQVADVLPVLAALDIGVLCSHGESLSNAIIEYMAAGIPPVVSDVGGNREAVGGEHGLVFPPDDLDAFVACLDRLIADPALRTRLGRAAADYARCTYEYREAVGRHETLYETCRAAARPRRRS
ncbi:MAG TPA: glycosyltransferase [candidate division Zixibacteria bacterium]|nr:glycosyltransferase [candidate division Zixibacteria bacterium]